MEMNENYQDYYRTNQQMAPKQTPKKMGTGKKILLGIVVGLLFGIFAGLGFEAVNISSGLVKGMVTEQASKNKPKAEEENIIDKITGDIDEVEEAVDNALPGPVLSETAPIEESDIHATVTDVTEVAKAVMPSVVSVSNKFINKMNYFGQIYSQEAESAGSGIIVGQNDNELLLVTNFHVIDKADEISVTFADDEVVSAQLKGTDEEKDLAVIAVQLGDIPSETFDKIVIAKLGDSNALTVGEPVVAIGNSLGYGQSVTTGVVSALNRKIGAASADGQTSDSTFIQTDAAINPGNSGGALVNIEGEVIGINSNKIGGSAVEGMGYAIPISDAKPIIDNLMSRQTKLKVAEDSKGYLGITGVNVEKQYSEIYGMPVGVYVSSVMDEGAADNAGLVRGDIIVALNEEKISTMEDLRKELEYYTAGTTVTLTIMQGSPEGYQSKDVEVTLGSKSE